MSPAMPKSQRQRLSNGELLIVFVQTNIRVLGILLISILAALWLYPEYPVTSFLHGLNSISLYTIAQQEPMVLAVGYNTNVDLIVQGLPILNDLQKSSESTSSTTTTLKAQDHAVISSTQALLETFAFWFEKSAAAERHIDNQEVWDALLVRSQKSSEETYASGGNAALMANQLAREGHFVVLGGPVGSTLTELLHANITRPEGKDRTENDEIHLILEYSQGSTFNGHIATRANRFIVTRDVENAKLSGMEQLHQHCVDHAPKALVTSGFHLLHDQLPSIRSKRIQLAKKYFSQLNVSIPIHLELASMADATILKDLALELFPVVDSIGLNEQELLSLYTALGGSFGTVITPETLGRLIPAPQAVAEALRFLLDKFSQTKRGLQRIHFHSFAFHMIAQVREFSKAKPLVYQNARAAVAHGSVVATLRACNSTLEALEESEAEVLAPLYFQVTTPTGTHDMQVDGVAPVAQWEYAMNDNRGVVRFHYAPVVVCKQPLQTVGLGDSISAAGLAYSLHNNVLKE